jgi:putative ABC transport system substrate-binding protein
VHEGLGMLRREFIAGLGSAAAWPVVAHGQPRGMPVIGYLSFGTPREGVGSVSAFLQGLAAAGYVEGRDVAVEFRWANHQGRQLLLLATELVQRQVAMIVALDGGPRRLRRSPPPRLFQSFSCLAPIRLNSGSSRAAT